MKLKIDLNSTIYIFLFIQICLSILGTDNFTVPVSISRYYVSVIIFLSVVSCLLSFILKPIIVKELVFVLLWLIVGTITFLKTKDILIIVNTMMIITARVFALKKLVWVVFLSNIFALGVTLICYYLGFALDNMNGTLNKHSFGVSHPNQLGAIVLVILLCSIYLLTKSTIKGKFFWSILILSFLFLMYSSGSRGGAIASFLAIGILVIYYWKPKVLPNIGFFIGIFFFCFSIYATGSSVYVSGSFLNNLDKILTNRIRMNNEFMTNYGIKIWGQRVIYTGGSSALYFSDYAYLDNAYLRNLINYGIVYSILFYSYILMVIQKLKENRMYALYIMVIPMLVYGFVEEGFISYLTNIILLLTSVIFMNPKIDCETKI